MIGMELPKHRDAEEADGVVAAAAFSSLLIYNTWTPADYSGLTNSLLSFQLVPTKPGGTPTLLGVALLMNMPIYRNQHVDGDEANGGPTYEIDIHIGYRQMDCIQPTDVDLRKCQIIDDSGVQGAKLKVVMRKLDSLGYIQGRCVFLTDPDIINKVRHHLDLDDSISEVKFIKDAASSENKDQHATKMIEIVTKA